MTTIQLPIMTLQDSLYRSPKRKREDDPTTSPRLITSGFRHNLDSLLGDRHDTQSPSTRVAGKFQKLGLQSPAEPTRLHQIAALNCDNLATARSRQTQPSEVSRSIPAEGNQQASSDSTKQPPTSSFTFEVPSAVVAWQHRAAKRSKSPTASDSVSDRFWQESEITGYSPGDPDEDDYGVNGVGYQKTPAVAHAISQKRKQQIAEYRSRETREARQKRGERRLNTRASKSPQLTNSATNSPESDRKMTRVVHFADG